MSAEQNAGETPLDRFRTALGCAKEQVSLAECALLIAESEYPGLDRAGYRERLNELGREADSYCAKAGATELDRLAELSRLFHARWGFRGNLENYYDPRNSFLNDVLDRRTGIPITLAVVYMEVGRRAGLHLTGVGMPGHFLLGCSSRSDIYVDAFSGGALLTRAECAARLRELQPDLTFRPEFLDPVGPREILARMLRNLLGIYLNGHSWAKALKTILWIQEVDVDSALLWRERGALHLRLKQPVQAAAAWEEYLRRSPEANDAEEVREAIRGLAQLRHRLN